MDEQSHPRYQLLDKIASGSFATVYRGREEVVHNFREFTASFEYYRFEIEELRDAGGDKVTAVLREQARGKASGFDSRDARPVLQVVAETMPSALSHAKNSGR